MVPPHTCQMDPGFWVGERRSQGSTKRWCVCVWSTSKPYWVCVLLGAHSVLAAGLLVGHGRRPTIRWAYTGPTLQQGPAFDGYFEFFLPNQSQNCPSLLPPCCRLKRYRESRWERTQLPGIERKQRFQNLVKMLLVWSWVGVPDSLQWNGAWKPSSLGVDRIGVTRLSPPRPWLKVEGVLGSFFCEGCSSPLGATRSKPGQALVSLLFQAVCLPLCKTPVQSHWLPLEKKCLWKAFLL